MSMTFSDSDSPQRVQNIKIFNRKEKRLVKIAQEGVSVDINIVKAEADLQKLESQNSSFLENSTTAASRYYLLALAILCSLALDYLFMAPAIDYILFITGLRRI